MSSKPPYYKCVCVGDRLFEESWLDVLDAQLTIYGSHDALYLTHSEHTAKERVTRVMAVVGLIEHATRLVGEGHTMIHTHRQTTAAVALAILLCLLEDAHELYQIATAAKVRSLGKVAVREDVAAAEVNEMGAVSKLASHRHYVVVLTC